MPRGLQVCLLALLPAAASLAADSRALIPASLNLPPQPSNWTGNFDPCLNRNELLRSDFMKLGVRLSTSNTLLAKSFKRAMDFWATVLAMKWHEEPTSACALQLVEGNERILTDSVVARSQFTEWSGFQGWIAFDPHVRLTRSEMYVTAVHEIGHLLGLKHNPNAKSVMYYLDLEGPEVLDRSDLASLAERHKLRPSKLAAPIAVARSGY
jgi:hypothetical protein